MESTARNQSEMSIQSSGSIAGRSVTWKLGIDEVATLFKAFYIKGLFFDTVEINLQEFRWGRDISMMLTSSSISLSCPAILARSDMPAFLTLCSRACKTVNFKQSHARKSTEREAQSPNCTCPLWIWFLALSLRSHSPWKSHPIFLLSGHTLSYRVRFLTKDPIFSFQVDVAQGDGLVTCSL